MKRLTPTLLRKAGEGRGGDIPGAATELVGRVVAHDILGPVSGEPLATCNEALSEDKIALMRENGIKEIDLLFIDGVNVSACLRNTLLADKTEGGKDAVLEIYRRLRPSNRPNEEVATTFFQNLFFHPEYYDLSPVGRLKLDLKLRKEEDRLPLNQTTLVKEDILLAVKGTHHPEGQGRPGGRHRPPGQPAGAGRGRTAGEPVPGRPGAHGTGHQGAHGHPGPGHPDAPRPDQCQAGAGRDQGILRHLSAFAVHGPDQSALRDHPQAALERPGTRRSDPGASRVRGAGRASHPLWPHLSHRDAGRSQHRSDRVTVHLRPGQ